MCQNVSNSSFFTPTLDNCLGVGTLALLLVAIFTRINFTVFEAVGELKVTGFCTVDSLAPHVTTLNDENLGFRFIYQAFDKNEIPRF